MSYQNIIEKSSGGRSWSLSRFQGCNGIAISHNAHIRPGDRGKGIGQEEHKARITIAKILDYSCMICTVDATNEVEKHILTKFEWTKVHEFHNKKSDNTIEIWVKNI